MGAAIGKSGGYFLDVLPSQGTFHVVMLGLDSAGKTTALYRLKFDQYLNTVPTIGFNCEKVQGTVGKAKGVQFLVWDVGGQEKLRPLWRSYTRCTDGILFVIDSGDVERMEEAKMELMRTAKCPDNQGVPVLILANKQDLPGARDPKELEKLLGLQELLHPSANLAAMASNSSSTGNDCSSSYNSANSYGRSLTPTSQNNKFGYGVRDRCSSITKELSTQFSTLSSTNMLANSATTEQNYSCPTDVRESNQTHTSRSQDLICESTPSTVPATPIMDPNTSLLTKKLAASANSTNSLPFKGWYIQPACAITGEGLQEGLEALYELILKRRKLNKVYKKKR